MKKKIAFQQILVRAGVVWQFNVVFKIESVCGIFPQTLIDFVNEI